MQSETRTSTEALVDVPADAIRHHLGPFLDPNSVIHLSQTCTNFHKMFLTNDFYARNVWKTLCFHRWKCVKFDDLDIQGDGDLSDTRATSNRWLQEFKRRHNIDREVLVKLNELNSMDNFTSDPQCQRICMELLEHRMDIMDLLQTSKNSITWREPKTPEKIERGIIRYDICEKFTNMLDTAEGSETASVPLEYGAILIAQFNCTDLYDMHRQRSLENFTDQNSTTISMECYIEKELNGFAQALLERLKRRDDKEHTLGINGRSCRPGNGDSRQSESYPMHLVFEEMKHFFRPLPDQNDDENTEDVDDSESKFEDFAHVDTSRKFVGNRLDYYSVENSMINEIIKKRKGIPITLAIIYSAIVRRAVGVEMDPMGLPGHFMLSTTVINQETGQDQLVFIDAFDGGKISSLPQVQQMITHSYNISWSPRYIEPVKKVDVWKRILRNLLNCHDIKRFQKEINIVLLVLGFREGFISPQGVIKMKSKILWCLLV